MCRKIFVFVLLLLSIDGSIAQVVKTKTDSSKVYRDIETYSNKGKFTKFIHGLFFKPVKVEKRGRKKIKYVRQRPYSAFEGKIIRSIEIETLDPFGYSITDTLIVKQSGFAKAANKLHIKTKHITIQNLLLIHKYQVFDSLLVKESERLIRTQSYVHEVSFHILLAAKNSDSVDIFIRELDKWTISPGFGVSPSSLTLSLSDKNFLGLGHMSQNEYSWRSAPESDAYTISYFVPNIRNTYINTTLHTGRDKFGNYSKRFAIDRPFYSPFAKWAAGVSFSQLFRKDSINFLLSGLTPIHFKLNTQDYWGGYAIQIFKGNTEDDRSTNLIFSGRYFQTKYSDKPSEINDPMKVYSNEKFYLGSIEISLRKYVQDKFIFNYGITEDVPVGKVYGLTGGYQEMNSGRLYLGARYSIGDYINWGYLSCNFEYGTFFRNSNAEQGVFIAGLNYFTSLFEIGKWKLRQFVKPQLTQGINRYSYENITINNENGIRGFNSTTMSGTKKLILTLQTQSYAPWNLLGFRFGPYFIYSAGLLGDDVSGFRKSRIYSQFTIGVLIKNNYLIFDIFQISVAFYPNIPGDGENIIKINPSSTSDIGFREFNIGKPSPILFQ